jgi:DNA-binding GntR family transcriptional regulator
VASETVANDAGADDDALGLRRHISAGVGRAGLRNSGHSADFPSDGLSFIKRTAAIIVVYERYIRLRRRANLGDIPPASLSETAYRQIKQLIVRLDLAPGAAVSEEDLQTRIGIGRTPIREALQRLERDQLVTIIPRRGVMVSPIDLGDLALLYESRSILEPYVHRLAAARGSVEHWNVMSAALQRVDDMGDDAPWTELLDVDRICHEEVWAAADNRFLTQTLDLLYSQSERLWHQYVRDVSDLRHALKEHQLVLNALRAGDGDTAADLIERHVRNFENQTREVLQKRLRSPLAL